MNAPRRIDQPEPGTFKLRLVSKGPWIAARITHAMGFWSASIGGEPCGPQHPDPILADGVSRIWESAVRIDQGEYDALLRSPPATPDLPINLGALAPITFEAPMTATARIGHNQPPIDLHTALEPSALSVWIAGQLAAHTARADELLAANTRFVAATTAGIANDEVAGRATDFARQIKAAIKDTDEARVNIKAPVLAAQRAIDGAAKVITDPLLAATGLVEQRVTTFMRAKDLEARRIAAEAAARAEEAAWHLQQQAEASNDNEVFDQAEAAMVEQQIAQAIVSAPTADLTRVRTALGGTAGLRDNWVYSVQAIEKVPAHFLMINDAAVKAAIKGGSRSIPGLAIRNQPKVGIR